MTKKILLTASIAAACLTLGVLARAADDPVKPTPTTTAPSDEKKEQHIMMDHSPTDTKAMQRMKDKKPKIHTAGDAPSADTTKPGTEHIMMDHSKGDTKSMQHMKDKTVKIHKAGAPATVDANQPCEEHIMMDHSTADAKAMRNMKDKTVKIHQSGNCKPIQNSADKGSDANKK